MSHNILKSFCLTALSIQEVIVFLSNNSLLLYSICELVLVFYKLSFALSHNRVVLSRTRSTVAAAAQLLLSWCFYCVPIDSITDWGKHSSIDLLLVSVVFDSWLLFSYSLWNLLRYKQSIDFHRWSLLLLRESSGSRGCRCYFDVRYTIVNRSHRIRHMGEGSLEKKSLWTCVTKHPWGRTVVMRRVLVSVVCILPICQMHYSS